MRWVRGNAVLRTCTRVQKMHALPSRLMPWREQWLGMCPASHLDRLDRICHAIRLTFLVSAATLLPMAACQQQEDMPDNPASSTSAVSPPPIAGVTEGTAGALSPARRRPGCLGKPLLSRERQWGVAVFPAENGAARAAMRHANCVASGDDRVRRGRGMQAPAGPPGTRCANAGDVRYLLFRRRRPGTQRRCRHLP